MDALRVSIAALGSALLAFGVLACRPLLRPTPVAPVALERAAEGLRLEDDGDRAALARAVRASLAYYAVLPQERTLTFGTDRVTVADLKKSLESFLALLATRPTSQLLTAELSRRFVAYRATTRAGILFTGYYLPTLEASLTRDARFHLPIYGRPPDLVTVALADFGSTCRDEKALVGRVENGKLQPYFTRAEIAAGAAQGAPVLAWVDDPIALFFLQIQGAGLLLLPDGTHRTIGFAASNGHPYVSIGQMLIERGHLAASDASMQGIRRWVAAHPEELNRVLNANPRYIFFRFLRGPVVGSLGVPVTAGRTIATDPAVYPPGALAFIRLPADAAAGVEAETPALNRLVLNQDAGAAIRGPGRVDVFFGPGAAAEAIAGRLKANGELYFLAPRL